MKVIGYMPLHYGKDYLRDSLLSVIDLCDKFVVLYTPTPSYGFGSIFKCPDSEKELKAIAKDVCGGKLRWYSKSYNNEGEHRKEIFKFTKGYDLLLAIDADEVFHTKQLKKALEVAYKGVHRNYGIKGYVNLWRSFNYACYDGFLPIRVINLLNQHPDMSSLDVTIWHFSCCQNKNIMNYKYLIHGHKDELRKDWLNKVFYGWTPDNQFGNLHPVAQNIWNAVKYDKNKMTETLKKHKFYNKKLI